MNSNLLILGAGGHGRVVKETANAMRNFGKIDFLDDKSDVAIGKLKDYKYFVSNYTYTFVALGSNELRMQWMEMLNEAGFKISTLTHPTAYISPSATIATGTIVCAKTVINTNVSVKKGCIVSIGALIDHDSVIEEFCHINTGAIIKANSNMKRLKKLDAGMVYSDR
ncbi:hypothetical protein [Metabacillus indicus]|uniref:PglD-related sugar-binding protein n=1 Tax=Metabacillus indicus TaxID=246786 RepID=UPI003CECD1EB